MHNNRKIIKPRGRIKPIVGNQTRSGVPPRKKIPGVEPFDPGTCHCELDPEKEECMPGHGDSSNCINGYTPFCSYDDYYNSCSCTCVPWNRQSGSSGRGAANRIKNKSLGNSNGPRHMMPDGSLMAGKTHGSNTTRSGNRRNEMRRKPKINYSSNKRGKSAYQMGGSRGTRGKKGRGRPLRAQGLPRSSTRRTPRSTGYQRGSAYGRQMGGKSGYIISSGGYNWTCPGPTWTPDCTESNSSRGKY